MMKIDQGWFRLQRIQGHLGQGQMKHVKSARPSRSGSPSWCCTFYNTPVQFIEVWWLGIPFPSLPLDWNLCRGTEMGNRAGISSRSCRVQGEDKQSEPCRVGRSRRRRNPN